MNHHAFPNDAPRPRRTFFSSVALGVCSVLTTAIICATGVVVYGMRIIDRKTDHLIGGVEEIIENLPELAQSLPPLFGDLLNDQRQPDYAREIDVRASIVRKPDRRGAVRPIIEIENKGDELVSLLSLHVVVLDGQGRLMAEFNEWGASPVAADDDWRGPLMPGSTRIIAGDRLYLHDDEPQADIQVQVEISDVRIWKPREHRAASSMITSINQG